MSSHSSITLAMVSTLLSISTHMTSSPSSMSWIVLCRVCRPGLRGLWRVALAFSNGQSHHPRLGLGFVLLVHRHVLLIQVQACRVFTFFLNQHTPSLPRPARWYCCGRVNLWISATSMANFLSLDIPPNIELTMLDLRMSRRTYKKV